MFTGIITAVGTVRECRDSSGGRDLQVDAPWHDLELGESIAVDGACLTVTQVLKSGFAVHVIRTSLDRTKFGGCQPGHRVNLERALRVGERLGGHLVQGHVDGEASIESVRQHEDARLLAIRVPVEVFTVCIPLGSIVIDGVALTVDRILAPEIVQVSLIPFTLEHTTLGERVVGDRVHVEGDTVGKYVQQFWNAWRASEQR